MDLFIRHRLEKVQNGNVLILYVNPSQTEFSSEFGTSQTSNGSIQSVIQNYIDDNLPDIRVKTIKIMVGTIMLSSFAFIGGNVLAAPVESSTVKVGDKSRKLTYIVQPGDSLYAIAKRFAVTVDQMKELNNLSSNVIQIGQVLYTPESTPTIQRSPSEVSTFVYSVSGGDTLYSIAKKFNVSVEQIKQQNNLTTDFLQVGQQLTIPGSATTSTQTQRANSDTWYNVTAGDTLYSIAKKFNVSVEQIKQQNNLTSNFLQVGQQLTIPGSAAAPTQIPTQRTNSDTWYNVTAGDTLYSIAKKFNVSVDQIKQVNNLTTDILLVGRQLTIPQASETYTIVSQLQELGFIVDQTTAAINSDVAVNGIKSFQNEYGLPITGIADSSTKMEIEHAVVKKSLVQDSLNYQGIPYSWGGTTTKGFDCSGFVYFMFQAHNIHIPRTSSSSLYKMGKAISSDKVRPGDLVFFDVNNSGQVSHVGFYVGNNNFISATSSNGIAVVSLSNPYWSKYYMGAKRVY